MKVTAENTEPISVSRYTAEASELGLAPGQWPRVLETSLGNGQPFTLFSVHACGTRHYEQDNGCITLLVLND